ncbi:unnamed protein product [Dicrocoelium dendriticum]|nr:unnamed protein product [Dicrocoelium dendriticum]
MTYAPLISLILTMWLAIICCVPFDRSDEELRWKWTRLMESIRSPKVKGIQEVQSEVTRNEKQGDINTEWKRIPLDDLDERVRTYLADRRLE